MKNNLLTTVLTWVLATSLILSMYFCVKFYFRTKQLRAQSMLSQQEMERIQNNQKLINSVVNDVAEYGKTHPAIDPILESYLETMGLKMNRGNSAAAKPAAK
jgi:hypothetical protein